jgi:hypothetical protein
LVEVDRSSQKVTILDESGERAPIVLENWHARAFIARFDALLDAALDVTLEAAAKYLAAPHIRCAWRDRTTSPAVAQPIAISPSAPHAAARV